jgi:curved DNA-binding protein CbpA
MIWVIVGFALLLLLWALSYLFVRVDATALATGLRWSFVGLGGSGVGVLAATGRIGSAISAGLALLAYTLFLRRRKAQSTSDVETDWLRMTLDHDTGRMEGGVRRGPHRGRRLEELSREEAFSLWRELRVEDEPSARLLETWLDHAFPDWREAETKEREAPPGRPARMSPEEALHVLGLHPGAGVEEIRAAHRRLMMRVHPDQGGSDWLAARLNEARDVLLGDA